MVENAYPARPRSSTHVASILKGCMKATTRQPKQARRDGLRCVPAQRRQRSVNLIRNCWLPLHVARVASVCRVIAKPAHLIRVRPDRCFELFPIMPGHIGRTEYVESGIAVSWSRNWLDL